MEYIKMLCSTVHLKLKGIFPSESYMPFGFSLADNYEILEDLFFDEIFKERFGSVATSTFKDNPFFYCYYDKNEISIEDTRFNDYSGLSRITLMELTVALQYLWFIKDNSVNVNTMYQHIPHIDKSNYRNQNTLFSTSTGEYKDTFFTLDDFIKANNILIEVGKLTSSQILEKHQIEDISKSVNIQTGELNKVIYKTQNRIERAILFLSLARSQSFLPLKIMFYICIYESLFTSRSTNKISETIRNRTYKFLCKNGANKESVDEILKEGYKIRSRCIHGNSLHNDNIVTSSDLVNISSSLDTLTREVLLKVIMVDSEYFIGTDKKLFKWLDNLQ